jgi:hypothetical protein
LKEEREERGEVDHAERAEEEPAREEAVARAMLGIEEPAEDGGGTTVRRKQRASNASIVRE